MMKLAQVPSIFGTIAPVPGSPSDIGQFIGVLINLFLIFAGFILLIFLLWGALDWITSGGDKEKVSKAQSKITNAVIGMLLIIVMLTLWNVIAGQVLHIINFGPGGISFPIPHL